MKDNDRTASLMSPARLARMQPQAPATPAAWLDQMAADVGRVPVLNLLKLNEALKAQVADRDLKPFSAAMHELRTALESVDFGLLQSQGWLGRLSGKGKSAGAQFAQQVEDVNLAAAVLGREAGNLRKASDAAAADRAHVEMAVEGGGLDQIVEQGGRWLQDMRSQLQKRHAEAADAVSQLQVKEDAARCEILVTRLKVLRTAGAGVQHVLRQLQDTASRRTNLLLALDQALNPALKAWQTRFAPLASAAAGGGGSGISLEGPKEAHQKLLDQLQKTDNAFGHLESHEEALAQGLDALAGQLAAAEE